MGNSAVAPEPDNSLVSFRVIADPDDFLEGTQKYQIPFNKLIVGKITYLNSFIWLLLFICLFGLYTVAFFTTSFIIISYSSEVKQYMTDVAVGLIILLATIIYSGNGFKNTI